MILVTNENGVPQFIDANYGHDMKWLKSSIKREYTNWEVIFSEWNRINIKSKLTNEIIWLYILTSNDVVSDVLERPKDYINISRGGK